MTMTINLDGNVTDSTGPSTLTDWERDLLTPVDDGIRIIESADDIEPTPLADRAERFRALHNETSFRFDEAINLLDVARLRNHAYRTALATSRARADESVSEVARLQTALDDALAGLARVTADLQTARTAPISLDDPRLASEWERAGEIASDEGFCSEYDRMCDRLGIPGRSREWSVPVLVSVYVSVPVTATSADDAQETVDEEAVKSALAHRSSWSFNVSDWEIDDNDETTLA